MHDPYEQLANIAGANGFYVLTFDPGGRVEEVVVTVANERGGIALLGNDATGYLHDDDQILTPAEAVRRAIERIPF